MIKENGLLYDVTEEDLELLKNNPQKFWEGVETINAFAFVKCHNLKSIEIPGTVKVIGENAFKNHLGLTSVKIADGVKRIERGAFLECENLKNVQFPQNLIAIGKECFYRCKNLSSVDLPSAYFIHEGAFHHCDNLSSVKISGEVQAIGGWAFGECKNLTSIELNCKIHSMHKYAFWGSEKYINITQNEEDMSI